MIKRSDWQAVLDEMNAEDRDIAGEPPSVEEARAYLRGELTPEEEERMRARLVAYPELVQALTAPFPPEEAEVQEVEKVQKPSGKVLQFWRASTALAAMLALTFGALLWRESAGREPRVLAEAYVLSSDGQRSGSRSAGPIVAGGDAVVLAVPLFAGEAHSRYRLELVDEAGRVAWRSEVRARPADDAFRIETSLKRGKYQVVLYGVDGPQERRLDTYSLRVR